jgi:heme/copper-type cytochrome/quinol oxidase subunit 4
MDLLTRLLHLEKTTTRKIKMFQIWHTLIIALFIVVAYWMGYNHGVRKIEKETSKNKTLANSKKRY